MRYRIIRGDTKRSVVDYADANPKSLQAIITSVPYFKHRLYPTGGEWQGGNNPACLHRPTANITKSNRKSTLTGGLKTNSHAQEGYARYCPLCGATNEDFQIGQEDAPEEYINALVEIFRGLKPALKPKGTVWVNIDDTASGSGGAGGDYNKGGIREGQPKGSRPKGDMPAKNWLMIPERFVLAMQKEGWILRMKIIWAKPNPKPNGAKDRVSLSHEPIYVFSQNPKYYFDYEAIMEPAVGGGKRAARTIWNFAVGGGYVSKKGDHFATMPLPLAARMVLAATAEGDVVLDPFSGLATTGVASLENGRPYVGMELSNHYADVSLERLAGVTPPAMVFSRGKVKIAATLQNPLF